MSLGPAAEAALILLRRIKSRLQIVYYLDDFDVSEYERARQALQNELGIRFVGLSRDELAKGRSTIFGEDLRKAIESIFLHTHTHSECEQVDGFEVPIVDVELRGRCIDLLSGENSFDRAVSQATLVLESRLRDLGGEPSTTVGVALVNKLINADPNKSLVVFSGHNSEQQGFADLVRGVFGVYRNPGAHRIIEYELIEAVRACILVDSILKMLAECSVRGLNPHPSSGPR